MEQVNVGQDRVMGGAPVEAPTETTETAADTKKFKLTRIEDYNLIVLQGRESVEAVRRGTLTEVQEISRQLTKEIADAAEELPEFAKFIGVAVCLLELGLINSSHFFLSTAAFGYRLRQIGEERRTLEVLQGKRAA